MIDTAQCFTCIILKIGQEGNGSLKRLNDLPKVTLQICVDLGFETRSIIRAQVLNHYTLRPLV